MYDGWTHGVKTKCPKCGSDDCNDTIGNQTVVGIKVSAHVIYCNTCGYRKEELLKDKKTIWAEEHVKKLKCNKCGVEYSSPEDREFAEKMSKSWGESLRSDGIEPTGIAPCPNLTCPGELVVLE